MNFHDRSAYLALLGLPLRLRFCPLSVCDVDVPLLVSFLCRTRQQATLCWGHCCLRAADSGLATAAATAAGTCLLAAAATAAAKTVTANHGVLHQQFKALGGGGDFFVLVTPPAVQRLKFSRLMLMDVRPACCHLDGLVAHDLSRKTSVIALCPRAAAYNVPDDRGIYATSEPKKRREGAD